MSDYSYAFEQNEQAFKVWVAQEGTGGYCKGHCEEVKQTTFGKGRDKGGAGYTFTMRCYAARMKKTVSQGIPAWTDGLERIWTNTACNVSCMPNSGAFHPQSCEFVVSTYYVYLKVLPLLRLPLY